MIKRKMTHQRDIRSHPRVKSFEPSALTAWKLELKAPWQIPEHGGQTKFCRSISQAAKYVEECDTHA